MKLITEILSNVIRTNALYMKRFVKGQRRSTVSNKTNDMKTLEE